MSGAANDGVNNGADDRLELALRASNEGIWDWWIERTEIYYSRRILEFLECPEAAAPNLFLPPHEPVHPDDRAGFGRALARVLDPDGPELLVADCRIRTGGGGWRWLRVRGTVVRGRGGEARRIVGSMIDISIRKAAQAQLEDERHLLSLVIENVPLQVYFKDIESRFVLANRRLAEWLGAADPAELIGKHDRDFFSREHSCQAADDERRIIETGEPLLEALEKETWQGREETWVLTSKLPWRDRHGAMRGTFGVSSDVTELVRAQQQSAALAAELAARNAAYEEELQLAREIQQSLAGGGFSEVEGPAGRLRFASRYVPISGLAGDFFEIISVGPGQAGLLICDVMGHGVRAALVVAMMRGLIEKERAFAADPPRFLAGLNHGLLAILGRTEVTIFVTAFYAFVDLARGEIRCANAGHPGAVAGTPDGLQRLAALPAEMGPALGLLADAAFPCTAGPLDGLRRLVLFTDGVIEAENPTGEPFLESRLIEVLGKSGDDGLDAALDAVIERVLGFAGSPNFDDDVCLLGVDFPRP